MKKFFAITALFLVAACQNPSDAPKSADLEQRKAELKKISTEARNSNDNNNAANLDSSAIALEANKPDTFVQTAVILRKMGQKQERVLLLQTGEKLNPENETLQLETAKALVGADRQQEAIDKLEAIKTLRNKDYYNTLGVSYDMTNRHKLAQAAFNEGLKQSPDDGLLQNNLALSYILDKQPSRGIDILKKLVKTHPEVPKYRQNLALAYGVIAKPDQARELLLKDLSKKDTEENLKFYKELRQDQ